MPGDLRYTSGAQKQLDEALDLYRLCIEKTLREQKGEGALVSGADVRRAMPALRLHRTLLRKRVMLAAAYLLALGLYMLYSPTISPLAAFGFWASATLGALALARPHEYRGAKFVIGVSRPGRTSPSRPQA
ncbi:MAG: hypothetical protein AB7O52_09600 [Planctomycetota bacterium]